jgi:hypothetical protein
MHGPGHGQGRYGAARTFSALPGRDLRRPGSHRQIPAQNRRAQPARRGAAKKNCQKICPPSPPGAAARRGLWRARVGDSADAIATQRTATARRARRGAKGRPRPPPASARKGAFRPKNQKKSPPAPQWRAARPPRGSRRSPPPATPQRRLGAPSEGERHGPVALTRGRRRRQPPGGSEPRP